MDPDSTSKTKLRWYQGWRTDSRLYVIGAVLLFGGFFGSTAMGSRWGMAALFAGYAFMTAGLVVCLAEKLRDAWKNPIVRQLVFLAHVAVLVITAMVARNLMTSATGLPGQDFTLGTSALSLLLYPISWLWLVMMLASAGVVIWQLFLLLTLVLHSILGALPFSLAGKCARRLGNGMHRNVAHFLGGIGLLVGLLLIQEHLKVYRPVVEGFARWAAFYGDYQALTRYPGTPAGTPAGARVLLHANGVYSTAIPQRDRSIKIEIWEWKAPAPAAAD